MNNNIKNLKSLTEAANRVTNVDAMPISEMGMGGVGAQQMRKPNLTTTMRPISSAPGNSDQSLDDSPEQGAHANGFLNGDGSWNFPNDMWQNPDGFVYLNTDPSDNSEHGGAQYWVDQIDHFIESIPDMIRHWVLMAGGGEHAYNTINEWWTSWYQGTFIGVDLQMARYRFANGTATQDTVGLLQSQGQHNLGALYNQYFGNNP